MSDRNDKRTPEQRLLSLLDDLASGGDDSTTCADIEALLEQEPSLLDAYVEFISLHSALRRRYYVPEGEHSSTINAGVAPTSDLPVSRPSRRPRWNSLRWFAGGAALAASLLVGIWLFRTTPVEVDVPSQANAAQLDQDASAQGVAILSQLAGVEWASGEAPAEEGAPLPPGKLRIESGVMRLEFYSGAIAVIEGPASFDLLSAQKGYIHYGKLRVNVPPHAKGFTIGTATGNVVDLGTEFALDVPLQGQSELHVLDGEVDYFAHGLVNGDPRRLVGGQAIPLHAGSQDGLLISEASRFIGPAELAAMTKNEQAARLARIHGHRERLRKDPSLVAHYTFAETAVWSRTLVNDAPNAAKSTDGAIVGCRWVNGRWPGTAALQFSSASHRVRINVPGTYDSLSMATWIRVDELRGQQNVALLHPETDQSRILHWTLDRTPMGAVLHFSESNSPTSDLANRNHYSSVRHGVHETDLQKWIHLAVVYDHQLGRVSHYRDGQILGATNIVQPRPLSIGIADIGNWPYKNWAKGTEFETRNLNGLMDEFLILGRALDADEIWEIYEVGLP